MRFTPHAEIRSQKKSLAVLAILSPRPMRFGHSAGALPPTRPALARAPETL
jgi:hypothetical protein